MDLKESQILNDKVVRHWYYRSKAKAMLRLLAKRSIGTVLDIGAGSGFFSKYLLAHSTASEAWCVDISYDRDSDERESNKPLHFRKTVDTIDLAPVVDLVLLMDILEHVEDEVGLLRSYAEKLTIGTIFLISVPAFQFLWSAHDIFLEHKRRYTLGKIEEVAEHAGLRVIEGAYYFGAVLPLAASIRLAERFFLKSSESPKSQLKQHHPIANEALGFLCEVELPLMLLNRVAGLTAFCLAVKE